MAFNKNNKEGPKFSEIWEKLRLQQAGNNSMECNHWIPKLNVQLGKYNMTDSFYMVNVEDTIVLLGVQYLYYREIYYRLYGNGNGILGKGWKTNSLEGNEDLSLQASILTKDGGCT